MIRLALIVLTLLFLAPSPIAQNTQCATRPNADSSNACASTKFVHNVTAGFGTVTSVTAGSGLDGGVITGSGTISVANIQPNALYFKSGKPWADVIAWGAACDGSTNDTTAIQNAINAVNSGGGTVFFPAVSGNCKVTGTLSITGSVCLVGATAASSGIIATTDITVVDFSSAVDQGCIHNLGIYGFQNTGATQPTVTVHLNAKVNMSNCRIWGGFAALYTLGTDGRMYNCFIAGFSTNAGAASIISQGANFYTSVKIDTTGGSTVNGFYQAAPSTPGTVLENHLTDVDFSGSYTNSILIDDGAGNSAVTWIHGGIMSSPIVITNAKWTVFTAAEVGSTTFSHAAGTLTLANSFANSATTLSGGGTDRLCSNNKNITC